MNDAEFRRLLVGWLAEGPHEPPSDAVSRALAATRDMRQAHNLGLPAWRLPWLIDRAPAWTGAALGAAIVLVVLGFLLFYTRLPDGPAASQSLDATTSPTTVATPLPGDQSTETPSGSPSPLATPGPSMPRAPAPAGWLKLADIEGQVEGAASIERGYVVFGLTVDEDDNDLTIVGYSSDGRSWQTTQLGDVGRACPGSSAQALSRPLAIASNGAEAVIVGRVLVGSGEGCANTRAVAWLTSDGVTWRESAPFGDGASAQAVDVWAAPAGWEAIVRGAAGEGSSLWRSVDGLSWQETAVQMKAVAGSVARLGGGSPDFDQRVIALQGEEGFPSSLLMSVDGVSWSESLTFPRSDAEATVTQILAPSGPGSPWLVIHDVWPTVEAWSAEEPGSWQRAEFPTPYLDAVAPTRVGFIAAGVDDCFYTGGECPPDDRLYEVFMYSSADGASWSEIEPLANPEVRVRAIIDGPAGIIAIGGISPVSSEVWMLEFH